mgnify:CR=1 FL=1
MVKHFGLHTLMLRLFSISLISAIPLSVVAKPRSKTYLSPFFTAAPGVASTSLHLRVEPLDFETSVSEFIHKKMPKSEIRVFRKSGKSLAALGGATRADFGFKIGDVSLCNYQVTANQNSKGELFVLGSMPHFTFEQTNIDFGPIPELRLAKQTIRDDLAFLDKGPVTSITQVSDCLYDDDGSLWHVGQYVVQVNGLTYRVRADENTVFSIDNLFFETTEAKISYYEHNAFSDLVETTYTLTEPTYLTSAYFETQTGDGSRRATSSSSNFVYTKSDVRIKETSAFIHAIRQYEFIKSLDYTWTETKPLDIVLHDNIGGNKNNALYRPAESNPETGKPSISLGDGDGIGLANLDIDEDVVSHEFGHHVIYRYLKSTDGESLVLHEGIADFLAMAKSGEPCLGRSICPEESPYCVIKGQCLRSAGLDLKYTDDAYQSFGPHLKGQVVSGLMWDLRSRLNPAIVTKIGYTMISFLSENAGLQDFLLGLLFADQQVNDSKGACIIYDAAINRGFSSLLTGVTCKNSDSWSPSDNGSGGAAPTAEPAGSSDRKKKNPLCGALTFQSNKGGGSGGILLLILGLVPLFLRRHFLRYFLIALTVIVATKVQAAQVHTLLLWEGRDVKQQNIEALLELRQDFPDLKLVHFIDPAYFMRSPEEAQRTRKALDQIFNQEKDEIALYLHGWKSTIEKAGVNFISGPTFWGELDRGGCSRDCGEAVPMTLYSKQDLQKIIAISIDRLQAMALPKPTSFLTAGWLSSPDLLAAIVEAGFTHDYSQVALDVIEPSIKRFNLWGWLHHANSSVHFLSQPLEYKINGALLIRVPFNTATVDYMRAEEFAAHLEKAGALSAEQILNIAFHQESAYRYNHRLRTILQLVAK